MILIILPQRDNIYFNPKSFQSGFQDEKLQCSFSMYSEVLYEYLAVHEKRTNKGEEKKTRKEQKRVESRRKNWGKKGKKRVKKKIKDETFVKFFDVRI